MYGYRERTFVLLSLLGFDGGMSDLIVLIFISPSIRRLTPLLSC